MTAAALIVTTGTTPATPASGKAAFYVDGTGPAVVDDAGLVSYLAGFGRVYRKAIAYNDANILTGATLYTPTIGDILLDAWFEITTAWNGTTPKGDIGQFTAGDTNGFFYENATNVMSEVDGVSASAGYRYTSGQNVSLVVGSALDSERVAPGRFLTANPLKYIVTQTGAIGGGNPSPSAGAGFIYLVIATPIDL